jgi:replicative DNA helicase
MALDTFNFSSDFQDLVLACAIRHHDKFESHANILQPEYFTGIHAFRTARLALDYRKQYGFFPKWEVLGDMVFDETKRRSADGEGASEAFEYVEKLAQVDTSDVEYVVKRVTDFARERAIVNAIKKSITHVQEGKLPPDFVKWFEEALAVGQKTDDVGYILHEDYAEIIKKVAAKNYGVSTGYPLLDSIWKNGWAPGWLIVPLAPPKRYKTAFCINLALNITGPSICRDVLYFACEISEELASVRALCRLSGQTFDDLYKDPEGFKDRVEGMIPTAFGGNLVVKSYPSKTMTIAQLKLEAKRLIAKYGIKPAAIVIDYAETVKPADTGKDTPHYRQQSDIYTDARAMGHELGCCIIMPDRCNKETINAEVPSMTGFQGAIEKAGIVDIGIGLCSTDDEYNRNVLRFFVFLNRHGPAYGHLRGEVDPTSMDIRILEEIPYEPQDAERENRGGGGGRGGRRGGRQQRNGPDLPDDLQD